MKPHLIQSYFFVAIGFLLFSPSVLIGDPASETNSPPATGQAVLPPMTKEPPDVPAIKLDKQGQTSQSFLTFHESFLKRGKSGPIGVLFMGDSITAGWAGAGKDVWKKYYAQYNAANFGIGGDKTQNVLWRIDNGELDGISPDVVVLLIGINNGGTPIVVPAIQKIVREIHDKLPNTKVLLLGIFPHGNDPLNPYWIPRARANIVETNKELAALDDGKQTRFLDIGSKFLEPSGAISKEVMPDGVHPGAAGYQIWADAMQPLLDEMLKKDASQPPGNPAK